MLQPSERTIPVEEKRAALKRVLESHTFFRCDQLKYFLSYVCEKEFAGKADEISEYGIGIDALSRPKDFSPQEDSTVRSRAYSLRQKLHEYYEQESPAASIRIDLPKGSYVPHFVETAGNVAAPVAMLEVVPVSIGKGAWTGWRNWVVPFIAGSVLASLVWLAVIAARLPPSSNPKLDPIIAEAWGPLVSPDANVAVTLSSPPHLHLHAFPKDTAELPYSNPPLLPASPQVTAFFESFRLYPPGSPVYMWRTNNSMLMGDVLAVTTAIRTLTQAGATFELLPEKMAGVVALRGRNVMRFGSPLDSSGVAFDLSRARLSIRYDPASRDDVIADKPAGEPGGKVFTYSRQGRRILGLLTVMPPEKSRPDRRLVVASGVASGGAHAAMEFFRSPEHMKDLKRRFASEGFKGFPTAYQVVVRCQTENSILMNFEYEAHIVLERYPFPI